MLIVFNLLVVALVIIGAFALSSSGARPKDRRSGEEAATLNAKIVNSPEVHQS